MGQKQPNDHDHLQGARESTERTLRSPSAQGNGPNVHQRTPVRTGMGPTHTKERDDPKGAWERTERTLTKPTTPRAHGNRPNPLYGLREWTERTRTIPRAHMNERNAAYSHKGARKWAERDPDLLQGERESTERSPSAHGNGLSVPERTPRRTGMDRTHTNEDDPQCVREWIERT